jgi:hypothetical protein
MLEDDRPTAKEAGEALIEAGKAMTRGNEGGHYAVEGRETIEIIEDSGAHRGFCLGNILKYADRQGKKEGQEAKDRYKVLDYLSRLLTGEWLHTQVTAEELQAIKEVLK